MVRVRVRLGYTMAICLVLQHQVSTALPRMPANQIRVLPLHARVATEQASVLPLHARVATEQASVLPVHA